MKCCLWLLLLLFSCSPLHAFEKITIATSEYAPYTSEYVREQGYINHILTSAFAEVGIEVEYEYMPWARAVQKSIEGDFQGASYGYYSKERDKYFLHSELLGQELVFLFGLKNKVPKQWNKLDDLLEFRVGVTRGYGYTDEIWAFLRSGKHGVSIVNTDRQNMQMILMGRIDLFPMEEMTAWHLLENHFTQNDVNRVQMLRPVFQTLDTHFIVPRSLSGAEQLIKQFNLGLASLRQKGKLDDYQHKLKTGYYSKRIKPPASKDSDSAN